MGPASLSKRQKSVADSSTAAEYMALYEAVKEAIWIKSLAKTINLDIKDGVLIYDDNNGCIAIANNPCNHRLIKAIDIKYHYSRDEVENGNVRLKYIESENQIADVLTKSLGPIKFLRMRNKLGLE